MMEDIKKSIDYLEKTLLNTNDDKLRRAIEIKLEILKGNKIVTK